MLSPSSILSDTARTPVMRGPVVLRDLAKLAAVDVSTVSRALNHDPRVSPERAQSIRDLAESVGYRPKPLRSKFARSIGLLIGSSNDRKPDEDYLSRIAWHVQRLLGDRNWHVNLECIRRDSPAALPALVQQNRVDGVLLAGHLPADLARLLRDAGVPAVGINDSIERLGISCARSDPVPAIQQAILHLAARGHQRFAMLLKNQDYPTSKAKHDGYVTALRQIGIEPEPAWYVTTFLEDHQGGREGIRELLRRGPIPTAIVCENDWVAIGAMHELQRQGMSVPDDVSVIGHDDLWVCLQTDPPLTSIHRGEDELIAGALELLLELVEGRSTGAREILVRGEMVWRGSTGSAPERRRALAGTVGVS